MNMPDVSLVVCTRDRPGPMLHALRSIGQAAAACREFQVEILVIENGSAPHLRLSEEMVHEAGSGLAQLLRLETGGLSAARNLGLQTARSSIVAFTDDDCRLDPCWLSDLHRHLETLGRLDIFLGGRVVPGSSADLPITIKDEPASALYNEHHHPGGFIPGCNFVISRDVIDRIGVFDTTLGAGSRFWAGEDTDYAIRAHLANIPLRYVPDMRVSHHHGRGRIEEVERLNAHYSFANGVLYVRYWRAHWLRRHLFWTLRAAVVEAFGGPPFDPVLGLRWRSVAGWTLRGMLAQLRHPSKRGQAVANPSVREQRL